MVRKDLVAAKLGELADRIEQIRFHRKASADDLVADRAARDLVSFNLMLAVQACADVAGHVIADEGWPPATTIAESFRRLAERSVVSSVTATALGNAVGLRNIVAHGYAGVDVAMLHVASTAGVTDLEAFASEVSRWLEAQPG
jgi:uncharacterized protein YutE (UPF0331/DUF86 family)